MTALTAMTLAAPAPSQPSRLAVLINLTLFEVGWLACVLGAARGWAWAGSAVAVCIAAYHLYTVPRPRRAAGLLLAAVVLGTFMDSIPVALGWVEYSSGLLLPWAAPYWIIALWLMFATTLNVSLRWLHRRYLLAAAIGAVAGPLAYYAGAKLGAMRFGDPLRDLAALACAWALILPLLVWVASRADAYAARRQP